MKIIKKQNYCLTLFDIFLRESLKYLGFDLLKVGIDK